MKTQRIKPRNLHKKTVEKIYMILFTLLKISTSLADLLLKLKLSSYLKECLPHNMYLFIPLSIPYLYFVCFPL